jgi:hypothetical protein
MQAKHRAERTIHRLGAALQTLPIRGSHLRSQIAIALRRVELFDRRVPYLQQLLPQRSFHLVQRLSLLCASRTKPCNRSAKPTSDSPLLTSELSLLKSAEAAMVIARPPCLGHLERCPTSMHQRPFFV